MMARMIARRRYDLTLVDHTQLEMPRPTDDDDRDRGFRGSVPWQIMKLETTIILPLSSDSNPTLASLLSVSLWPSGFRQCGSWRLGLITSR